MPQNDTPQIEIVREAIEAANLGLAELDKEGRFTAANPAFLSMLRVEMTDLLGRHWHATVHPDDRPRAEEAYRLARTEGRGYVEIRGLRGDSSTVYEALTVSGLKEPHGGLSGYHCLRHDISNYKRDQEALMLAVESVPSGLLILNPAGEIQFANSAVETLFGYKPEELRNQTVEMLLPERFRGRHVQHRDLFCAGEGNKLRGGRDLVGLRKDGVEVPLQVYLNRIVTNGNDLTLCTIIDIADRVRSEQQLKLAIQAAEAANRAKSDFLARMSHEIRTPMNLINGMNALLLESPLNAKQRRHVEISNRNVKRLLRLINGILDISKVEAGQLTLESEPFDLHELLKESAATIEAAVERKGLDFQFSIDAGAGRYWLGDPERLQQVLLNLIGNSVKFTARGGIEVRVRPEHNEKGAPGLRFEVKDTGCGVPPDKAGMIFEAFQQADNAMNRTYEGTGLGLAISKTLVEMMSGRIWLKEMPEPGAKFIFTVFFPAATEAQVSDRMTGATSAKSIQALEAGTRILIVEDNAENTILIQAYLEDLALSLNFASNGVEALEMRRQASYDLILMDIQMPIMDGYTATREIRTWEYAHHLPRIPIVALTAHALSGAAEESMDAGCDGHLTKPVERNDLVEAIAKHAHRPMSRGKSLPESIALRRPAFLANRQLDLAKMRDALGKCDFDAIRGIGHNCRGIGAGYGFPSISDSGAEIEAAARKKDREAVAASIQNFERCLMEAATLRS